MDKMELFPVSVFKNRGLLNVFSGQRATPEQSHDLLTFCEVGSLHLEQYIKHRIIKEPSTIAPVRKHKLLTMECPKVPGKRRISHKDRENKQVVKCLRQRLVWCNRSGNTSDEQYSPYPRAICDENGIPHKSSKATWTEKLQKRYDKQCHDANSQVIIECLPRGWKPQIVIIDGMFLIQCNPLRQTMTITEYAKLLFNRFMLPHYQAGAEQVHVIFDAPQHERFNPKVYEQNRRDTASTSSNTHEHISFQLYTRVPKSCRATVECRQCKRSLIDNWPFLYTNG